MIAEIKQTTERKTSINRPVIKAQAKKLNTGSKKLYSTLFFLLFIVATLIFSLRTNQLFLKELAASALILCYVLAMQLNERRMKLLVINGNKP